MPRRALALLRRSPLLAALAAVLVLAMTGLGVAAALPGSGSTIHACIKKQGGALRVVGSASGCRKSERAISFDKQGPRGLTGATGPQGPAGVPGPAGPQGPAGRDAPTVAPPHQAVIGTATIQRADQTITFDIVGMHFGATAPSTTGGAGAGKITFDPIRLVKRVDSASPKLVDFSAHGFQADTLTIDLRRPGAAPPYREYVAKSVFITNVDQGAPDGGGRPVEDLTLAAGSLQAPQAAVDPPSGGAAIGRLSLTDGATTIGPVPVFSSSFQMSNTAAASGTGGAGTAKPTFRDLVIHKSLDSASEALFAAMSTGRHFTSAKLELFSAAGGTDVAHTYDLGSVVITSFDDDATGETSTTPVQEQIALNAVTVKQTDGATSSCWDIARNASCG